MKYTTLLASALALSITAAHAGDAVATSPQTYSSPMTNPDHIGWYLGAGVDYLTDAEEAFYNGHVGYDFGNGSSLFLESGWIGQDESPSFFFPFSTDVDVVPVTLNYKYEYKFTEKFGFYVGAGAGASYVDVNAGPLSDDDWVLTLQGFAGVVYNVSETFEVYAGARYMWLDDVSLFGANVDDLDDVGVGAGIRFNF
ncbi:porin family protein [Luteolibacter flavescens]|uniref:Porin family protein n=1 Tax=Luteolibacter flavescens TaxID=1859460 RepID=A0ABT3FJ52_9BACT|nr:porin family protein [Luteolibacter flavescens]MCW1883234.1 porin family protein [Luteolibacter flavescens]